MIIENRNFYFSIIIALCLTMILTTIPVWQLVIIPGIIAGFFNKSMKRAMVAGLIGVFAAWIIYILHGLITRNVYSILDQFGALIISTGYGWLLLVIIILMGAIFGALGGGFGYGLLMTIKFYIEKESSRDTR